MADKFKEDEMGGNMASVGQKRNAWKAFVRTPEGRRTL